MKKHLIIFGLLVLSLSACKNQSTIVSMTGERVAIDKSFDFDGDSPLKTMVAKYKKQLDAEMGIVIGETSQDLTLGVPQSPLTNLTSDVMLDRGLKFNKCDCDLALMNVNGHRAPIGKGKITLGSIYETYSFDNALSLVKIKGKYLTQVFESYAKKGGGGTSHNVKAVITKDKKLESLTVNGKEIDPEKVYTLVTLDYLAEGNDGMGALKNAESVTPLGIILRNEMIEYITAQSKEGKEIVSPLDGRIILK